MKLSEMVRLAQQVGAKPRSTDMGTHRFLHTVDFSPQELEKYTDLVMEIARQEVEAREVARR